MMDFYAVLDQVVALLQRRGRVTYSALKLQFHLDDDQLAVLKDELLYAHPQVVEDAGRGLRWTSDTAAAQTPAPPAPPHTPPPVGQANDPSPVTSPPCQGLLQKGHPRCSNNPHPLVMIPARAQVFSVTQPSAFPGADTIRP
jgi:hypothetical protein